MAKVFATAIGRCLSVVALLFSCVLAVAADEPPPPASMDDKGVEAWLKQYIKADGWTFIWADDKTITLGSPSGVAVMQDNTLQAEIRREYYLPMKFGDFSSRSNTQDWIVDCSEKKIRIVAMDIYRFSNLAGEHRHQDRTDADWTMPDPNSANAAAMDRICRAPTEGKQRPVN